MTKNNNKTLLIVGGSGFFGKSFLDYFLSNKEKNFFGINKIIFISRKKKKIKFKKKKNLKIIYIYEDIKKFKKLPICDYIIYCATSSNYNYDFNCFKKFINLVKQYKKKLNILFTSSGAVYGKRFNKKPIQEDEKIDIKKIKLFNNYKANYAISKLKMEKLLKTVTKYNHNTSIARCFSFFGKHILSNDNYAISSLIKDAKKNDQILLNSKNSTFRSYLSSNDLVFWLLKILKNSDNSCEIFNVGSDEYISIDNLALIVSNIFKKKIIYSSNLQKEHDYYLPNIHKAKKILNLNVKIKIKKSIMNLLKKDKFIFKY